MNNCSQFILFLTSFVGFQQIYLFLLFSVYFSFKEKKCKIWIVCSKSNFFFLLFLTNIKGISFQKIKPEKLPFFCVTNFKFLIFILTFWSKRKKTKKINSTTSWKNKHVVITNYRNRVYLFVNTGADLAKLKKRLSSVVCRLPLLPQHNVRREYETANGRACATVLKPHWGSSM